VLRHYGRSSLFNHRPFGCPFVLLQRSQKGETEGEPFDGTRKESDLGELYELGRDV
jgi:hypothetical protein